MVLTTLPAIALALASPTFDAQPRVLSVAEMRDVVGGEAAAVTFKVPRSILTHINSPSTGSVIATGAAANANATRCMYASTIGPSHVGFDATTTGAPSAFNGVFVVHGTAAPKLEVLNNGTTTVAIATGTKNNTYSTAEYDLYELSLRTECVGGPNDGAVCHGSSTCGSGGICRTCDQAGNCNSNSNPSGPCPGWCVGGSTPKKPCYVNGDCAGGGTCSANEYFVTNTGCFLAANCCTGGGGGCIDCTQFGLDIDGNPGSGDLYVATARVTHGSAVLGYTEELFRMEVGNSNDPAGNNGTCSTDCKGPVDVIEGGQDAPACE